MNDNLIKTILLLIFALNQTISFGQVKIESKYYNMFGEQIEFYNDSTYKHTWHFDLASSWTNGKWKFSNDTIYLTPIFVIDTLSISIPNKNISKDSLVLSSDEKQERIENEEYVTSLISGGGQYRRQPLDKLLLKNGKLYQILDNGNLDKIKHKAIMTNKKYKTYFKPIRE